METETKKMKLENLEKREKGEMLKEKERQAKKLSRDN